MQLIPQIKIYKSGRVADCQIKTDEVKITFANERITWS